LKLHFPGGKLEKKKRREKKRKKEKKREKQCNVLTLPKFASFLKYRHAMSRWNDRRNQFKKIGRYGDIVSFNTLDVLLQTKSMADFVGAEQIQADGTFEACGSRGETANDVGLGHLYEFETIQADSQRSFEAMDQYTNPRDQKSGLWFNVAFGANDQLRQRIAWSLSTIIVVAEVGVGEDRNSEIWGNFFDIFVKHAFGNYHDIVREASYSPMMGKYLTYRQNKGTFKTYQTSLLLSFPLFCASRWIVC